MYETIINRFAKNKSELYSEYIKLCIPEIITMLVISDLFKNTLSSK